MNLSRRNFLGLLGATALAGAFPLRSAFAGAQAHVVIIGGGVGGATTAKYLRMFDPNLKVTVIEKNPVYIRPYGSSEVVTGHISMDELNVSYEALKSRYGVNVIIDEVTGFDPDKRSVKLKGGREVRYDKLVVSPGIELLYDKLAGYSQAIAESKVPSGWIPGAQTALLAEQLKAMPQGGTFLMVAPPNPYRCPPGPYERPALVAEWLQKHNPTAKVIITDPKDKFVTDQTMMLGWNRLYDFTIPKPFLEGIPASVEVKQYSQPGILEWIPAKDGGTPVSLDVANKTLKTEGGDIKADVINIVPAMRAGKIATAMGLTDDKGWCPNNRKTFESTLHPHVHVIGDACHADAMPKSGFSANTQAKSLARALVELLAEREAPVPVWENTCYALAGSDYGLYVADVFELDEAANKINRVGKFNRYLRLDATPAQIRMGAVYQQAWLKSFTEDCFA
ncbi:FCSD flavin-binding domain-containing protein [Thiothrix lacustris]|uniref:FCSD flavin-binding domain-containing protein n=1 Tax=Thiothrix lacustris TaxID=525917 RepID=A0ABY9MPK9_9GAMM|nr:FCSD flavin-binding domain-containing protein [Thiothrix lacustris]WML90596.1 FCSD flavin-binding domain-containing protein [Thiothrix lacustris]